MEDEIFYLDWNKDKLDGFEGRKNLFDLVSIAIGIENDDEFPAVPVVEIAPNHYQLSIDGTKELLFCDGGHRRAVAHFVCNKPLKCIKKEGGPLYKPIHIQDIVIFSDIEEFINNILYDKNYRLLPNLEHYLDDKIREAYFYAIAMHQILCP